MTVETIEFSLATSEPIERRGWFGDYLEELRMSGADLTWFNSGNAKVLLDHNPTKAIGNIKSAEVRGDKLMVTADFDDELEEGRGAIEKIRSGLLSNTSIGWDSAERDIEIHDSEENYGDTPELKAIKKKMRDNKIGYRVIYHAFDALEASFVSIPADKAVGIGRGMTPVDRNRKIGSMIERMQKNKPDDSQVRNESITDDKEAIMPEITETKQTVEAAPAVEAKEERSTAGYETIRASKRLMRELPQDEYNAMLDTAVKEGWDAERARSEMLDALEKGNPKVEQPAFNIGSEKRDYSIAKAIQEAYTGNLGTGRGSLEAEMHADAAKASARKMGVGEYALPHSLLVQDKRFVHALNQRLRGTPMHKRELDSSGNAGILTDAFDEMYLVEALYPRAGLFNHVSFFPEMLNQDLKVPVEVGTHASGWTGEETTRTDTDHPTYNTTLTWEWHEIYSQFNITRQLIDQTAYLYDRVLTLLNRDIPRNINNGLWNATGSGNQPTGILNWSGVDTTSVNTNSASSATDISLANINAAIQALDADNASYVGEAMFFANAATMGKLRTVQKFTGTNGDALLKDMDDGSKLIIGHPCVKDNFLPSNGTNTGGLSNLSKMVYLIPQEVKVGWFSDMVLIVDPYSAKKTGKTEIQIRQALDWQLLHTDSAHIIQRISQ